MIDWPIIMGDRWAAVTAAQTAPLCITCVIDSNPDKGEGRGGDKGERGGDKGEGGGIKGRGGGVPLLYLYQKVLIASCFSEGKTLLCESCKILICDSYQGDSFICHTYL